MAYYPLRRVLQSMLLDLREAHLSTDILSGLGSDPRGKKPLENPPENSPEN